MNIPSEKGAIDMNKMGKSLFGLSVVGIILFLIVNSYAEPTYVGAKKCKMCHFTQYKSWLKTKHATAFDVLKDDEKKNEKCNKCHITGSTDHPGVQCESCHGPGSDYKKKSIMKDPEKSKAAGLTSKPDEKTCLRCHNEESPHYKKFVFEERVKDPKGIHKHKKKKSK